MHPSSVRYAFRARRKLVRNSVALLSTLWSSQRSSGMSDMSASRLMMDRDDRYEVPRTNIWNCWNIFSITVVNVVCVAQDVEAKNEWKVRKKHRRAELATVTDVRSSWRAKLIRGAIHLQTRRELLRPPRGSSANLLQSLPFPHNPNLFSAPKHVSPPWLAPSPTDASKVSRQFKIASAVLLHAPRSPPMQETL
jgi:hypothetical protein